MQITYKIGQVVYLAPTAKASKRTKELLIKHGLQGFEVLDVPRPCLTYNSSMGLVVRSITPSVMDGKHWLGIFKICEVTQESDLTF